MAFEFKDGDGSLFFNNRKSKENHPDYTGKVQIAGQLYRIAGWKKTMKSGAGFLSLRITPQQVTGEIDFEKGAASANHTGSVPVEEAAKAASDGAAKPDAELNDEIPF
jgi:hypothetical protein